VLDTLEIGKRLRFDTGNIFPTSPSVVTVSYETIKPRQSRTEKRTNPVVS